MVPLNSRRCLQMWRNTIRNFRYYTETDKGRQYVYCGLFGFGGICAVYSSFNNSLLTKYDVNKKHQLYEVKQDERSKRATMHRVPVSIDLELTVSEEFVKSEFCVRSMLTFPGTQVLDYYISRHLSVTSQGEVSILSPCRLGLPLYFVYSSTEDLVNDFDRICTLCLKPFNLSPQKLKDESYRETVENLIEAMSLSDNAKRFGIHNEFSRVKHLFRQWFEMIYVLIFFILPFCLAAGINIILKLHKRRRVWRVFQYCLTIPFCYWLILSTRGWYFSDVDQRALKHTANKGGLQLVEGGIEYCQKQLLFNRTLRGLLGPVSGPKKFTEQGELVPSFFLGGGLSLSDSIKELEVLRKQILKEQGLLDESESSSEQLNELRIA